MHHNPRCRICSHKDRALIDRILLNPRISKDELIRAVSALSLRAGVECPSYQSIRRHRDRHLGVGSSLDPAPDDFVVGDNETIADEKSLSEAMVYSVSRLSSDEFTKFNEAVHSYAKASPPIWTLQFFEVYLLNLVDSSIPWKHEEIRTRFRQHISKYYPQCPISFD